MSIMPKSIELTKKYIAVSSFDLKINQIKLE
jgi:hypothetical protein